MEREMTQEPEQRYWKSLRDLYGEEPVNEIKADEFMRGVTDDFNIGELPDSSRRKFLALLSASAAFAAAGCTSYRDKGEIVPYLSKPEETAVGLPVYYASTCDGCGQACGILVKTREGRPIKIDGNPEHPVNKGAVCAMCQASVLNLYDPYRLRAPMQGPLSGGAGAEISWRQAYDAVAHALGNAGNKEIAIVAGAILSPTLKKLLSEFTATHKTARVYSYDIYSDAARMRAWKRCYGTDSVPAIRWTDANVIVTLESDVLGVEGASLEAIRQFASRRDALNPKTFNRLYCIEGAYSATGTNADFRIQLRPDAQREFLEMLLAEISRKGVTVNPALRGGATPAQFAQKHGIKGETLERLVTDLLSNRGKAIVYAGSGLPEDVHMLALHLNDALGNSVLYDTSAGSVTHQPHATTEEWSALVRSMKAGNVAAVIHFDSNPVYHLPDVYGYAEALKKVPFSVSLTETVNETSELCSYVLPIHHALESWGDFETRTGVISMRQPMIAPLYSTRQKEGLLLSWMSAGGDTYSEEAYYNYLKTRWEKEVYTALKPAANFESFWNSSLHDGVVVRKKTASLQSRISGAVPEAASASTSEYAVVVTQGTFIGDGKFANNGWLQEIPDPVTKVVWDNYAVVSVRSARELGVRTNDLIEVETAQGKVTLPVFVQPGVAQKTIAVSAGYGRRTAGPVGSNVGVSVTPLFARESITGHRILAATRVVKKEGTHKLVSTQEHHSLDDASVEDLHLKRNIIREGSLAAFVDDSDFIKREREKKQPKNIAPIIEYKGVKWAMSIDLNKCVGCNACVAGCNVENNIPVVGKDQVDRGREMQWIRIDRYFSGTDDDPLASAQPMLCQHCDNAPCEKVCPVAATTHSPDGLNQMTYNRCVGTKYCSNNCPYKVRRFNFYNFRDNFADGYYLEQSASLVHNPEVTVRSRGVMEKCTFCVQRIHEAKTAATAAGRQLKGSDVVTACQQACPAQAITFGDMNDPHSEISAMREHPLAYGVLEEINTRPNVTYIARLRNI